jgi:hypothetical protein
MSLWFSTASRWLGALGLLLLAGGPVCAQNTQTPRSHGRRLEVSDPKSGINVTNFNTIGSPNDPIKQWEDEVSRPFKGFTPVDQGMLEGVVVPPPRAPAGPVIQNKKVQELLEKKKNWAFMNPEDLTATPTAEQILNVKEYGEDGKEKRPSTSLQRFYQRLDKEKQKGFKLDTKDAEALLGGDPRRERVSGVDDEEDDPRFSKTSQRDGSARHTGFEPDKSSLTPDTFSTTMRRGSLSDIFGLGDAGASATPETLKAQKARLDEYRQFIGLPANPAPAFEGFNPLSAAEETTRNYISPGSSLGMAPAAGSGGDVFGGARLSPTATLPAGSSLSDAAHSAGTFNPPSSLPRPEPPRATPPAANFTAPKRVF